MRLSINLERQQRRRPMGCLFMVMSVAPAGGSVIDDAGVVVTACLQLRRLDIVNHLRIAREGGAQSLGP
jgi:hypothetical protein